MTGYQFILVQCFSILFAENCKPRCRRLLGVNGRIVFLFGKRPRDKTIRWNFGSFQRDLSVWTDSGGLQRNISCASNCDSNYNFGQGIIIQCCVPVPDGEEILIHEDEVCCKKYIGWIGDFRRSHQVGRRLTSSWHQKKQPIWTKNCGIQTQKGGL